MLNILRADFYKLFKRKSFYICGIIAAFLGVLDVLLLNTAINTNIGIDASILGYNGIYALSSSLGNITLLLTIFISMFIPSEFSFGTIKNIASRGISRSKIYLSKLIVGAFVTVVYTFFSAVVGFTAGSIMWGTGEFTNDIVLNICKTLCLFLISEFALQSINIMIGFIVRHTGGTVAINLGIIMIIASIIQIINFASKNWFNFELEASKYWLAKYYTMLGGEISNEVLTTGIIVSLVYFVVSSVVGMYVFSKRDIK